MARDVEELATKLSASDVETRRGAAEQLNSLAEDASPAGVALVKALADSDETVQQLVNSALEGCGAPPQEAVDELEHLLMNENADIAYWAATLLGRLEAGAIQAVESLKTAAAEHTSDTVRKRATWALGKIATG
jgi:hypothetical protein